MLRDRINLLTEGLHISITDIARAGGCSPSNLSRLRAGTRTPPASSPTVAYLVKGIMALCREAGLEQQLSELTDIPVSETGAYREAALTRWLYENDVTAVEEGYERCPPQLHRQVFSTRLDQIMELVSISNGGLSRESGLSSSYISRLRRGERMPKYSSKYIDELCRILLDNVEICGKAAEYSSMTGISAALPGGEQAAALRAWLFDHEAAVSQAAVNELLGTILSAGEAAASDGGTHMDTGSFKAYLNMEKRDIYKGTDGMRCAAVRFLSEALENGSENLLLYSDGDMSWMGGSFSPILSHLMQSCIRAGMKVSIIHNVDRSMPELLEAIRWWLPLYMTGNVTSYYSSLPAGERFAHTLFVDPGRASVSSLCFRGGDASALIRYCEDGESIAAAEKIYEDLMKRSAPLVEIGQSEASEKRGVAGGRLRLNITKSRVTICRTEDPLLSFRISHPMICRAFRICLGGR